MSTFSPAIAYSTEVTQVSTGNIPFGTTVSEIVQYTNSNTKELSYFIAQTARLTVAGGSGQQLTPTFYLQAFNTVTSVWYDISGPNLTTSFQSYASVGTTHEIAPDMVSANNIITHIKLQVPYNHRVVANFQNPGSNSGTWDIFSLVEKYKSA